MSFRLLQIKLGSDIMAKHSQAEIKLSEIDSFYDVFKEHSQQHGIYDALFRIIGDAFHMGVAVGSRNYK